MRNSSIELLRIILMLMIIALHLMMNHETFYSLTNVDEIIELLFRSMFCVAVDAFVLISGFYGIQFKKERLFNLVIQSFFYSTFFMVVVILLGWHPINIRTDMFALIPILTKRYWFITSYFALYAISPWLNKWVESLDSISYRKFLLVGFFIVYVWPTFNYMINAPQLIGDAGYGLVNFVYLYMLGRYIHLYYSKRYSTVCYLSGYFLFTFLSFICQYSMSWMLGFEFTSWMSYNTVFCLLGSICLFMSFKEMTLHSPVINYWAKPCLAVYLIHMSPYILIRFCLSIQLNDFHGFQYLLLILTLPFFIYTICAVIEICRSRLMGRFENKLFSLI